MAAPATYPMPPPTLPEPAEAQSIREILRIVKVLAIVFGILFLVLGIALAVLVRPGGLVGGVWLVIGGIIGIVIYLQMGSIEEKFNARQYEVAKTQTLIWTILGFFFGIILGLILLIAFLKFDPLINWQRTQGAMAPPGYVPPYAAPAPMPAAPAAPPPSAPAIAPAPPFCPKCGKPTTFIAQYGRYYCYTDGLYV